MGKFYITYLLVLLAVCAIGIAVHGIIEMAVIIGSSLAFTLVIGLFGWFLYRTFLYLHRIES